MNSETVVTILCGLAILVGVAGTIIPVLPGSILIGLSLLAWAIWGGAGTAGWVVFAMGMVFVLAGMAASAVLTGRKLKEHGIPSRSVVIGLVAGVVGMFIIPVVGLFVGFAAGLLLSELLPHPELRHGNRHQLGRAEGHRAGHARGVRAGLPGGEHLGDRALGLRGHLLRLPPGFRPAAAPG